MDRQRFRNILNMQQFAEVNQPLLVGPTSVVPPDQDQYVLRMLVQSPYSKGLKVPSELEWALPLLEQARIFQKETVKVSHPYTYITIRNGTVKSVTDDQWHVDGFSMRFNHLPEANYVCVLGDAPTTEYADQCFPIPGDFDPLKHNIHSFFQRRVNDESVKFLDKNTLYLMDPYVIHRRPPVASGVKRCFIRMTFSAIEIPDCNNTINPLINTSHYSYDGVKEYRQSLADYDFA